MSEPLGRVLGSGGRPRKLSFLSISQSPADLFQRGERVTARLGTDVDLAHAHALGATASGGTGPRLSSLTGGAGNKIRVNLNGPDVHASTLTNGEFRITVHYDGHEDQILDIGSARLGVEGDNLRDWAEPCAQTGVSLGTDLDAGSYTFDFGFTDETSAQVVLTYTDLKALATAQMMDGLYHANLLDVSSLIWPLPNAVGKTIASVNLYKTTPFMRVDDPVNIFSRLHVRQADGTLRQLSGYIDMTDGDMVAAGTNVLTPADCSFGATPQVYLDIRSLRRGQQYPGVPAGWKVTGIDLEVTTPFASSAPFQFFTLSLGIFGGCLQNFAGGVSFDLTASGVQHRAVTDVATAYVRKVYYAALMSSLAPASLDVAIDAATLIAGADSGALSAQSGTAGRYGNAALAPYAGYVVDEVILVVGGDGAAAQYGPGALVAPSGLTAYFETAEGSGHPAQSIDLRPTVGSYEWPTPPGPAGAVLTGGAAVKVDFNLFPKDLPPVSADLLVTEPYPVAGCGRAAFRFRCVPPMSARPADFTSPRFKVLALATQGPVDGRTLWTPIVMNVQSTEAHGKSGTDNQISLACYPFVDALPDDWDGATLSICAAEYSVPWAFVRFLILPDTGNASGYVLSIAANADGAVR